MTSNALPRRQFLRGGFLSSLQSQRVKQQGFAIIRPPWAIDEVDFINACNRCGDCIRQCETQVSLVVQEVFLKSVLPPENVRSAKNALKYAINPFFVHYLKRLGRIK